MTDLLNYTKILSEKIAYYNAIADFTEDSHWLNPFYKQPEVTVIWVENQNDNYWDI